MEVLRVLVIDDEPGMRMAVERTLKNYRIIPTESEEEISFEVNTASTGEEGLEIIASSQPHILLLDYKLPSMSGLEILNKIYFKDSDIVTIMITAYASFETAVSATKCGAYDFLAKPFTPDELKNSVRKAAGRYLLLRKARILENEKRKMRFQFTSVLAHELKAPLAAIDGYLQIMNNKDAGEKIEDYKHIIERSLIRLDGMRKLITDLLDMTRIESGERKRELTEVDIGQIISHAIETITPEAKTKNIFITFSSKEDIKLIADPGEIEIILNNLLSNAVKYNIENGVIKISASKEGDFLIISVSDTGIGLSPEDSARLFNDFVRVKNEQTRNILGSGLGLSTVKKLAILYEGDVSVKSQPGKGSTFTVKLKNSSE